MRRVKQKIRHTYLHRVISVFLCLYMVLSAVSGVFPFAAALSADNAESNDMFTWNHPDALHFFIRHWHSEEVTEGTQFQTGTQKSGDRYFVVAEGYIVPNDDKYDFYFVYQNDMNDYKEGDVVKVESADGSDYIDELDFDNGAITLKANPIKGKDDTAIENFSAFSISAGHDTVSYGDDEDTITITYDPSVHLVKGHVFYISENDILAGTNDESVFGEDGLTGADAEVDTVNIYVYIGENDFKYKHDNEETETVYKTGDIVKQKANSKVACDKEEDLPEGMIARSFTGEQANVKLTKFYNTNPGLHTDKTVIAAGRDGRTFDIELESWYAEKHPPQVGMILDASGSMAFASATPNKIQLKDAQINALGIKQLTSSADPNDETDGWDSYFLTDTQISSILNKRNTDNSRLSVSGYSYFVYDQDSGTMEYAPLGYWEGVVVPPVEKDYAFKTVDDQDIRFGWPSTWHSDYRMTSNGFHISGNDGTTAPSSAALLLDATPKNDTGSFTVSFILNVSAKDNGKNIAELLYIGPMSGNSETSGYYRLFRDQAGSSNRLRANQNPDRKNYITDINNVFNQAGKYRVTLVFENAYTANGTVTSYLNNNIGTSGNNVTNNRELITKPLTAGDTRIILNGIKDNYDGVPLFIDDIYVFNKALSKSEVESLNSKPAGFNNDADLIGLYEFKNDANTRPVPDGSDSQPEAGRTWMKNSAPNADKGGYASEKILDSDRINIMNNSGVISVPTIAKTSYGKVLGVINTNGPYSQTPTLSHMDAGWYYVTHTGNWGNNYANPNLETAKRLVGIPGSQIADGLVFTDSITMPDGTNAGGTKYEYKASSDTPIKFYVDSDGYLRCFFTRGNYTQNSLLCSYVYELSDKGYVKTESLQRALGDFVTQLNEKSPMSKVSAVRFSLAESALGDNLDKLVLLDWTNDPGESASVLSLMRGNGGTINGTESEKSGIMQYNYGLTGNTATLTGLQSYKNYLNPNVGDGEKYLIIFTDGADTGTGGKIKGYDETISALVKELKEEYDYTIFTVMLNGGPVKEGGSQYETAHDFLVSLSGNSTTLTNEEKENYFYSVSKAKREFGDAAEGMDDSDILTAIFSEDILSRIAIDLEDYTVKDYIDSRFDLVDVDNVVWHLNANGNVVKGDGTADEDRFNVTETDVTIHVSNASGKDAKTPYLCYDDTTDLYYLEWVEQTIPGCAIGAEELSVWHSTFTVKAKDDFIGGNAVSTNGNAQTMNYVYDPEHADTASSGTDMAIPETTDDSPSKGFPRTTVNVALLPLEIDAFEQTVYLGESITPAMLIKNLSDTITNGYYWAEYLTRYANANTDTYDSLEVLLQALVDDTNEYGIELPYAYLSNVPLNGIAKNQAGENGQQDDVLGVLHYKWVLIDPDTGEMIDMDDGYGTDTDGNGLGPKKDNTYTLRDSRTVQYKLIVNYWPYPDPDDKLWQTLQAWEDQGHPQNNILAFRDALDDLRTSVHTPLAQDFGISNLTAILRSCPSLFKDEMYFNTWNPMVAYLNGLSELNGELAELQDELLTLDPDTQEYADKEVEIALKTSEINEQQTKIDEKITVVENYIDYVIWCLGYWDEAQDKSTIKTTNTVTPESVTLNGELAALKTELDCFAPGTQEYADIEAEIAIKENAIAHQNAVLSAKQHGEEQYGSALMSTSGDNKLNMRDYENADLIVEEAYTTPKNAVGNAVDENTVNGTHASNIVRGELAFEMTFAMKELYYMFSNGTWADDGKDSVDFTVDITRAEDDNKLWFPAIPSLNITVDKNELDALKEAAKESENGIAVLYYIEEGIDDDGNEIQAQYPKALYNSNDNTVTFYSDPRVFNATEDYANQLPLGTYTLTPSADNHDEWFMFEIDTNYAPIVDYERINGHFTDAMNPINSKDSVYYPQTAELGSNYYAYQDDAADGVVFGLGTETYDGHANTEERVGMAKVTAKLMRSYFPATGGVGTLAYYLCGAELIAIGVMWFAFKRFGRKLSYISDRKRFSK